MNFTVPISTPGVKASIDAVPTPPQNQYREHAHIATFSAISYSRVGQDFRTYPNNVIFILGANIYGEGRILPGIDAALRCFAITGRKDTGVIVERDPGGV